VQVSEGAGPQKVRAWGPGLETGLVGRSADFVVEAIGTEVGTLGRSQRPIRNTPRMIDRWLGAGLKQAAAGDINIYLYICIHIYINMYIYTHISMTGLIRAPGPPGFSIEGPSQARIECEDKGDGSCDVRYWPTEPGDYAVHVVCDDEDIRDSPFMARVLPAPPDTPPR